MSSDSERIAILETEFAVIKSDVQGNRIAIKEQSLKLDCIDRKVTKLVMIGEGMEIERNRRQKREQRMFGYLMGIVSIFVAGMTLLHNMYDHIMHFIQRLFR